jgi:transcriptional regulator with XRE-family HTH domain
MKTLNEVVIDRLNYYMGIKNLSQYMLAELSGVPYPTIKSLMQKRTNGITLKTVFMLSHALGVTVSEFFDNEIFYYDNLILE